ncbi:MAG TPA: hypothetical protein VF621_18660 [Pyrinomonadaceae bacterium]|jgi:uncharacterized membrane protein YhdT
MLPSYTAAFAQMRGPSYFPWIAFGLLSLGALGWLIAAALGFARARAFGESPRWFAISAVCLLLYHIQIFVFVIYGISEQNAESLLAMGAFFNLFVALGAVCAIIGFMRMNDPRTEDLGRGGLD